MTITAGTPPVAGRARPVRLRQLPGLDGLRAIAVIAVIVYHLNSSWLPGGFLGVDVFFVISGYLITALLMSEHRQSGTVVLRRFWTRRARRLLPALGVLILTVTLLAALFARDALGQMRGDVPAAMFYVLNWRLVFEHSSYIASFGRPPLLQHLWSLAVEEQFYLLWPLGFLVLRRRLSNARLGAVALGLAAVSAALMGILFSRSDPSAVYFATYTHADGLLLGCALAAAVPPWRMTDAVTAPARRLLERSGVVALGGVLAGMAVFGFGSAITYRGGIVLVDVATAVVVATTAHPASRLGAALGREPLRWIGRRSYSLYLWHWPVFELLRPGPDVSWPTWEVDLLRVGLTVAAAELSYRYVEQPWRDGRAESALRIRLAGPSRRRLVAATLVPPALVALVLTTAPGPSEPAILAEGSTPAARSAPSSAATTTTEPSLAGSLVPDGETEHMKPPRQFLFPKVAPTTTTIAPPVPPPGPAPATTEPVLAVGDSVLLAASPALSGAFGPSITVDAQVGRQVATGLARLAAYKAAGTLSHFRTVVVDLGTNGTFTPAQFTQLSQIVAGIPHVVVYDLHGDRPWMPGNNTVIQAGVAAHASQMHLVDWNSAATAPGLLYSDGIHPDQAGAGVYAHLLEGALKGW